MMTVTTTLGRIQNPVRGALHGSAAVASVFGMIWLLTKTDGTRMTAAVLVYGLALVTMYSTSSLYHSIPWRPVWKARFQKLDHTFIYILVAGTFTPLVVGAAYGAWMVLGLAGAWALVLFGIGREFGPGALRRIWMPLQVISILLVMVPLWITIARMENVAALLVVAGGLAYLLGTALFVSDRPRLVPGVFSHHEFFHVVVIVASAVQFMAVWRVITGG